MLDRFLSLLVALCLAFLVWLYARSRDQENLDNVPIPVQIALAPGQADHYDLEVTGPAQVSVSFIGPPSRIRELRGILRRGELHVEITLTVPEDRLNESRYLDTVRVSAADVHVPPGVTPVLVEGRNRIPVTLHRLVERTLPVHVDLSREDRIGLVTCRPPQVLVRGPQEILDRAQAIATQPCTLSPETDRDSPKESPVTVSLPLVTAMEGRPVHATPEGVTVELTVQPRQRTYVLTNVPVRFLCPAHFDLQPRFTNECSGTLTVRVKGPATAQAPAVIAYVDLTRGKFRQGVYTEEPLRLQLPEDFQLAQEPPIAAEFQLTASRPELGGATDE
jgi:hypothetical protein